VKIMEKRRDEQREVYIPLTRKLRTYAFDVLDSKND
jgi:hypothetical protein